MNTQPVVPGSGNNAGKRQDVVNKATEAALPPLVETDPVASYLKNTRGNLGTDHRLDY